MPARAHPRDEEVLADALDRAQRIASQLGARGKSSPIKNSWSMRKYSSLTFEQCDHDHARLPLHRVRERQCRARVVRGRGANGVLRVRNFRVSSPKLPEQAKLLVR